MYTNRLCPLLLAFDSIQISSGFMFTYSRVKDFLPRRMTERSEIKIRIEEEREEMVLGGV